MKKISFKVCIFTGLFAFSSFALGQSRPTITAEGSAMDYNIGEDCVEGGNDRFNEKKIQISAVRDALLKVIKDDPSCVVPILREYNVVDEEYFSKCSWVERYRVRILATFECVSFKF